MSLTDRHNDLIRKSLDRELNEEESREVELLIDTSPEFKEELLLQKAIISSLKDREKARKMAFVRDLVAGTKDETSNDLNISDQEPNRPVVSTSSKPGWIFKIAAGIVLLLVSLLVFYLIQNDGASPEELYAVYYKPLEASVSTRSNSDEGQINPLDSYEAGDYITAAEVLSEAVARPNAPETLKVYLALSLLETSRPAEATALLRHLQENYPHDFVGQHASWYLALIALNESGETARKQFELIAAQGGIYESQARKLLSEM